MKLPYPVATGEGAVEKRRSMRVHICIPILVRGTADGRVFEEKTCTVLVGGHGCMMLLAAKVARSEHISIINIKTAEELRCTVNYIGQSDGGKTEVGAEFLELSPVFWRIVFPPDKGDPSERKRPSFSGNGPATPR